MHLRPFLAATTLTLLAGSVSAQIYNWKDASGRVHYADNPPSDGSVRELGRRTRPVPTAEQSAPPSEAVSAPVSKTWDEQDQAFRERRAEQAESEAKLKKEQADRDAKAQYCSDQRRNLAMLDRGGKIGRPNDRGEVEVLSDAQVKDEAARLREKIAKDCAQ